MNIVICLFLFFYINCTGWKFVTALKPFEKESLWDSKRKIYFSGHEMFILLTLACAIINASLDFLAIRLLLWLLLLLTGIAEAKRISFGKCAFFYSCYLLLLLVSLYWSPAPDYGFRTFLKYLLPFQILLFVPGIIENEELFPYAVKWTCRTLIVYFCLYALCFINLGTVVAVITEGVWWWGPAICDSFSIFLPLAIIAAKMFSNKKYLWIILGMLILPLSGYVIRTGLVALVISAAAIFCFRYKLKAVPFLIILALLAFGALVHIPQLRAKMFFSAFNTEEYVRDYEHWSWGAIDSSGRFEMWDDCLRRFFYDRPWFASGVGSEQEYFYNRRIYTDFGAGICHCDYVQILCDNGLVGIIIYGIMILTLIIHSFFLYNDKKRHIYCRYAAFIAGTGMCGMAVAMMTDNVVNYSMCTLVFPFSFYAIALGYRKFAAVEEKKRCSV